MSLAKATITIFRGDKPRDMRKIDTLECMFNPTEYSIAKSNNWEPKRIVGTNVPPLTFSGGNSRSLTMQLFFDVYEKNEDVRVPLSKLWKLAMIDPKYKHRQTNKAHPPICQFQWGGDWSFRAVVESLTIRYTLFREDGVPVRATADVTFKEAEELEGQSPTDVTATPAPQRKRRVVEEKENLPLIAFDEYGDANQWRKIALENKILNPLRLKVGQVLSIPPLD